MKTDRLKITQVYQTIYPKFGLERGIENLQACGENKSRINA